MKRLLLLISMFAISDVANAHWLTKAIKAVSEASTEARVTKEAKVINDASKADKLNPSNSSWVTTYAASRVIVACTQRTKHINANEFCKSKEPEISGCIKDNQSRFLDKSKLEDYCVSKYAEN